jgi:MFS family permease
LKVLFPAGTLFMVIFYLMPTQLPFLLKSLGVEDPSYAGNALAINALGMVCSSVLYSKIRQRFSFLAVAWLALSMMGAGYFLTGNVATFGAILAVVFLAGLGLGLFIANLNFWVLELSPPEVRGKSMGTLTACLFLGQFSSPIIAEPIIRSSNLAFLFMSSLFVMVVMGVTLTVSSRYSARKNLG